MTSQGAGTEKNSKIHNFKIQNIVKTYNSKSLIKILRQNFRRQKMGLVPPKPTASGNGVPR